MIGDGVIVFFGGCISLALLILPIVSIVIAVKAMRDVSNLKKGLVGTRDGLISEADFVSPPEKPPQSQLQNMHTSSLAEPALSAADISFPKEPVKLTKKKRQGLESIIGERVLAWIGAFAVIVGIAFFLHYAFVHGWFGPEMKVLIIFVLGIIFLISGEIFHRKKWIAISRVFTGIGIAADYFAAFAASHNYYAIVDQTTAFAFMIAVTVFSIALSVRYNSVTIAMIAFLGGLFTPVMLSGGKDQQVALTSYVLLLDIGVLVLTYFKKWRWFNLFVFFGTVSIFFGWMAEFYDASKLDTTLLFLGAFFLLFCAISIVYHLFGKEREKSFDILLIILNAAWAFFTSYGLLYKKYHVFVGLIAVVLAAVYLIIGLFIKKLNRNQRHFALVTVGITLTFLTLAIPIQLEGNWITIAWAVQAAILFTIATRVKSRGMAVSALFVQILTVVSLLIYWNTFKDWIMPTVTFFACVLSFVYTYFMLKKSSLFKIGVIKSLSIILGVVTHIIVLCWLSFEIDYYFKHFSLSISADYARHLALSSTCAIYATVILVVGLVKRAGWLRILSLVLFAIIVLKVFIYDLSNLKAIYRVMSASGIGGILLLVSLLYHKYKNVLEPEIDKEKESENSKK